MVDLDSVVDLDARCSLDRAGRSVDACDAGAVECADALVAVGANGVEVVDVVVEPVDLVEDRLFDGLEQLVQSLLPPST